MKPTSITRRSDRQRGRKKQKPDLRCAEQHYIEYGTADDAEEAMTYDRPIRYRKVPLDIFIQDRDTYSVEDIP